MRILDKIETEEETFYGIIDYVNKKHVLFFDTSRTESPDIVLLVISWRSTYQHTMRFSVFKDIFFPNMNVPSILIPKRSIISGIEEWEPSIPEQKRTRQPKKLKNDS